MDTQDIIPFQGLGDLQLGTTRSKIRSHLGDDFRSFKKSVDSTNLTDAYDELGLHLYYDDNDRLEFIETFPPADPTYNNISLLTEGLDVVLRRLSGLGYTAIYEHEGYNFEQLGFVLYVPDEEIEAVAIYRPGYYD